MVNWYWRNNMGIKEQIEKLNLQERRQLSHAFDIVVSQYVIIPGTTEFVGVHLVSRRVKHLKIKEEVGVWSYGEVLK